MAAVKAGVRHSITTSLCSVMSTSSPLAFLPASPASRVKRYGRYSSSAESTFGRSAAWDGVGSRLWAFKTLRTAARWVEVVTGREGCVLLWKKCVYDISEVVGREKV